MDERGVALAECGRWLSGGTPSTEEPRFWGGPIPWITASSLKSKSLTSSIRTLTPEGARAGSRIVPAGTLIFVVRGMSLKKEFRVGIAERDVAFGQDCKALVPAPGLLPEYLYYALVQSSDNVLSRVDESSHGTGRLETKALGNVRIRIPPLPEQRRIAEILGTVDEAIRSTERLIAKMEHMEQGLLHDLLTRGIDENGELRDSIVHPDQFDATPLGTISKALTVRSVGELLARRPKNGHSPHEADSWTGTWMLGLGCLTSSGFVPRQLKAAPRNDPALVPALLRDGDLLMSRSNTREMVGLVGRYRDVGAPCTYPDLMMRLVPNDKVLAAFLELALRSHSSRRQIQSMASGTSGSMVKIGSTTVMKLMVVVPARDEQERIVAGFAAFEERLAGEVDNLRKLRLLKSGLMDDLLTGRVRVKVDAKDAA